MKLPLRILITLAILGAALPYLVSAQTKEEQMRQLKEDLKQQQEQINFIQQSHDDAKKKQLDELNREKKLKEEELARTQAEANQSKEQAKRSQQELEVKSKEAQESQKELVKSQEEIVKTNEMLQHQNDSLNLLKKEQDLKDLELNNQILKNDHQRQAGELLLALLGLALAVLVGVALLYRTNRRKNRELAVKNNLIEDERKKYEQLLLNILPQEVVDELKTEGKKYARSYHMATVLFADIKDFTRISEKLSPEELVTSLDAYFEAFDGIIAGSRVEKIKTIGDAYVCVGGVPTANESNPVEVVRLGLEFQKAVMRLKHEREKEGKQCFDMRIGIHTGPLVAGVVGIKKFAYDIWGDTVNMASRLQQYGEPYQINISQDTYEIIKGKFSCTYRGKIDVKGKGVMDMYFVDREK